MSTGPATIGGSGRGPATRRTGTAVPVGAASVAAKSGGNTGTGTLTMDATTPILAFAIAGVYAVRCIEAAACSSVSERSG